MSHFGERLAQIFAGKKQVEIAEMLGVTHTAVRNYLSGRVPDADKLQMIAKLTGCDLHWLLTGESRELMKQSVAHPEPSLEDVFERRVTEIVHEILNRRDIQDLGSVDEFDVAAAIGAYDDPHRVMSEWFRFEQREPPADYGVMFADGWENYSRQEKIDAVRSAKEVLDRTLRKNVK